ncbi:MAG: hypothetical protein HZB13_19300 [Acidobacteria bacterium]|nr:hypothetical protein [Acidobacteriota bacterium]
MGFLNDQVRAILWAQTKGLYNRFSGGGAGAGRIIYWISILIWYGGIGFLAWLAAATLPEIAERATLQTVLNVGLLLATLFWQLIPVMLATTGISLDLKSLLVYPIAPHRLFIIEVLLRLSTGVEVLIVMAGAAVGLARSPVAPWWSALVFIPFTAFNLLLSAGVRDLLTRLLTRRGVREVVVFGIVIVSALPQLLVNFIPPEQWKRYYSLFGKDLPAAPLPWQVSAALSAGPFSWSALFALVLWLIAAAWFGYSQFRRGLRWDAAEAGSKDRQTASPGGRSFMEAFYRLPSRLLPDPLGALVEKEFRFLSRAPRFRLVFFMGFSFGIIIWLPMALGNNRSSGAFSDNILVWVSLYAALLLGEVLFWNNLGFDRSAAQAYYVMPVKLTIVLYAKNITAVFFLVLEVTIVTLVITLLRIRFPLYKIPEAYAVTLLICLFLLAIGNLASTHYPRPVDPAQSWRQSSSGKIQALLLFVYPVLAIPVALAYLARYAFDSQWAFYLVLLSGFLVAAMAYHVSLHSSIEAADHRRESLLAALSRTEGPIA